MIAKSSTNSPKSTCLPNGHTPTLSPTRTPNAKAETILIKGYLLQFMTIKTGASYDIIDLLSIVINNFLLFYHANY